MCPALASWGAVESGEAQRAANQRCPGCGPEGVPGGATQNVLADVPEPRSRGLISFSLSLFPLLEPPAAANTTSELITQQSQVASMLRGFDVGIRRGPDARGCQGRKRNGCSRHSDSPGVSQWMLFRRCLPQACDARALIRVPSHWSPRVLETSITTNSMLTRVLEPGILLHLLLSASIRACISNLRYFFPFCSSHPSLS